MNPDSKWLAIDVGNSAIKWGLFTPADFERTAGQPSMETLRVKRGALDSETLQAWLPPTVSHAFVTTVCRPLSDELAVWWKTHRAATPFTLLANADIPLVTRVQHPDRVGTDRLVAALAAGYRKQASNAAIVVDAGSAVTVDLVGVQGEFLGGAILPGTRLLAQSLHQGTAQLPAIPWAASEKSPEESAAERLPVVGRSTFEAIQSGIAWGLVGAVRELIHRISAELPESPDLFITGGDGPWLARQLSIEAIVDPHLVLQGIAWASQAWMRRSEGV